MTIAHDPHETLTSLVDLAVASDDATRLVAAASQRLRRPIGLVDAVGSPVAAGPPGEQGQRALAVAGAAARHIAATPGGWRVFSLVEQHARLGFLAVGPGEPADAEGHTALQLLPLLVADQLRRGMLVRLQRTAFVRRLVSDPPLTAHVARREAAELGLNLADAYWPAVLDWHAGTARAETLEAIEREARRLAHGSLVVLLGRHLVLLHPAGADGRRDPAAWLRQVVRRTRELAPSSRARVIAGERVVDPGGLSADVAHLEQLARLPSRVDDDRPILWASQFALDELLAGQIAPGVADRFVRDQIGRLLAWDREHRTDLARILEAALDFPRHDQAARRCFVHRNTFRHRLAQATSVLGVAMEDPDRRLAVHVALKLWRLAGADTGVDGAMRAAPAARGGREGERVRAKIAVAP